MRLELDCIIGGFFCSSLFLKSKQNAKIYMSYAPNRFAYIEINSGTINYELEFEKVDDSKTKIYCATNPALNGVYDTTLVRHTQCIHETNQYRWEISSLRVNCFASVTLRKKVPNEHTWEVLGSGLVLHAKLIN